jgi:hypothetical protein
MILLFPIEGSGFGMEEMAVITQLNNMPDGVLGFEGQGKFTAADYETVLIPVIEKGLAEGRSKLLFVMPDGFKGMELGAMRDDLVFGVKHYFDFRKFAFVTDDPTLTTLTHAFSFMIPAEMRVFKLAERDAAVAWLAAA